MHDMQNRQMTGSPLLTAGQVQGMLGVDRSTVYRMAEDGRLPALKIGRQWRFPPDQIERLLVVGSSAVAANEEPSVLLPRIAGSVIGVVADLLGVMMLVTDMQGRPLTSVANPCPWFAAAAQDHATVEACVTEWGLLADELDFEPQFRAGHVGFECARSYIRSGAFLVGMVLAGGVAPRGSAADGLYPLDDQQRARVLAALPKVAAAISRATSGWCPPQLLEPTLTRSTP